ncbi:hypothetical protein [Stigmatella erecta]|uniref:hypothetical protein n=1 Tax=Stigmatella erecta TaxID=83460 RepID=UPI0015A61406|nr:hypothetical protein [Stigmatella erecta]
MAHRLLGLVAVLTGYTSVLVPGQEPSTEESRPGSLYANASPPEQNAQVLNAENALGPPDETSATVLGLLHAALVLDLGEGEEGTGDLRVYYSGVSIGLATQVEFLRADGSVISRSLLQLAKIRGGNEVAAVKYKNAGTPYRYVRLNGGLVSAYQVDAVMAVSIVEPAPGTR